MSLSLYSPLLCLIRWTGTKQKTAKLKRLMLKSKLEESEWVTTISENSRIAGSREANSSLIIGREGGLNIITENSDREKYIVLHFYLSTSGKWKIQNNVCWYSRHFAEAKSFFFFESSSSKQNHNHFWHNQQLRSLIVFRCASIS